MNKTVNQKKSKIYQVFDLIAPRYDMINRILSARQDVRWRKKMAKKIITKTPIDLLDLATGTGDVMISVRKHGPILKSAIGIDPSIGMIDIGRKKAAKYPNIDFKVGQATCLEIENESMDVVTMAFGIRNVADYEKGLAEIYRVLKPGGQCLILEFSIPPFPLRPFYLLYFRYLLPMLGSLLSGHKSAYQYLNESVEDFPYGAAFEKKLTQAGLVVHQTDYLSFGIAAIYGAVKPQ